ncbi:MAG: hypothetical protein Q7S92_00400 [Candidatus Diapherotrites archaeon]|nr:hypothetical protein [Candidatus Diapherotrites archaeon]
MSKAYQTKNIPWKDQMIWWRPWLLFILIYINAFVFKELEIKFFFIFIILIIWGGLSWLTLIGYATMIVPTYWDAAYGWITLHSFMLLLGVICILQVVNGMKSTTQELIQGIAEDVEQANPTPPGIGVIQDMSSNIADKTSEIVFNKGGYRTRPILTRVSQGTQEFINRFFGLFGKVGGGGGSHGHKDKKEDTSSHKEKSKDHKSKKENKGEVQKENIHAI